MADLNPYLRIEMASVPSRPTILACIESCDLLRELSNDDRRELAANSFMAYAERGELIWTAGSWPGFVAVVGNGFVSLVDCTPSGREVTVELLGPGRCFGFSAAVEGRALSLSAVAATHCWYLKIPTQAVTSSISRFDPSLVERRRRDSGNCCPSD
jgi:CRP-like cAMP-binding protein